MIIIDGFGRAVQTRKSGAVWQDSGVSEGMNLAGRVIWDAAGRSWFQGQPVFEPGEQLGYTGPVELAWATETNYDVLGRPVQQWLPDGAQVDHHYRIDAAHQVTRTTDPEGSVSESRRDARGNIVQVTRYLEGRPINTRYGYNVLGEILEVIDAEGNTITSSYDSMGRRVRLDSPDRGVEEFGYDGAGNLIRRMDENLRSLGGEIRYRYRYNRLERIEYPRSQDVLYSYGGPGAAHNGAGRLVEVTGEYGSTGYRYGLLGETTEVVQNLRRLTPGQATMSFTMGYRFDYLGRTESITYPDGERVEYAYDHGGQVTGVEGIKSGERFEYVSQIGYDEQGQRVYIRYGNGTESRYRYDPERRWLSDIQTHSPTAGPLQNTSYDFDLVGNVSSVVNDTPGRRVSQSYTYDELHQLVGAVGVHQRNPSRPNHTINRYTQNYHYDTLGRMTEKISTNLISPIGNTPARLNYHFEYQYDPGHVHRATEIGPWSYEYDGSGNVTQRRPSGSGTPSPPDEGTPDAGEPLEDVRLGWAAEAYGRQRSGTPGVEKLSCDATPQRGSRPRLTRKRGDDLGSQADIGGISVEPEDCAGRLGSNG